MSNKKGGHPGLFAKYERLVRAARERGLGSGVSQGMHAVSRVEAQLVTQLQAGLRGFSISEQTRRLLRTVLDEAGADHRHLYRAGSDGKARLSAGCNAPVPNPVLHTWFNQFLAAADPLASIRTITVTPSSWSRERLLRVFRQAAA